MNRPAADVHGVARLIDETFRRHGVRLSIGGEPTFLPEDPSGEEWQHAAVGPEKLAYARALADRLLADSLPGGATFFSPGKLYPAELDPRWCLWLVGRHDGRPVLAQAIEPVATSAAVAAFRRQVCERLGLEDHWREFADPAVAGNAEVWALLLDADPESTPPAWSTARWPATATQLVAATGPAGLRLPFHLLDDRVPRRGLVIERREDRVALFLPPVLQPAFRQLLDVIAAAVAAAGLGPIELEGSLPPDEAGIWICIGLAADPGVLEVNLPACDGWTEYDRWMRAVSDAATAVGLRPWRLTADGRRGETGGGNHLVWGCPPQTENPFFTRPGWLASILRYWQRHPALSYCFTGDYLGPWSQAPRADESGRELHDLEWTWGYLDSLPPGDRRQEIADALRHLQADLSGNTHRTEISFDKFWYPGFSGGTQGLVEFRAVAMMPETDWTCRVALLWGCLAAWLLERPCVGPLANHGRRLHDRFCLPSLLWHDLEQVLGDLARGGFPLDAAGYRAIWEWRFPTALEFASGDAVISVRRAGEPWPILVDPPKTGGLTSRFVDSSTRRFEFLANEAFARDWRVTVNGRPLPLATTPELSGCRIAGLRYRHSRLYPALHPGMSPQLPLRIQFDGPNAQSVFELAESSHHFQLSVTSEPPPAGPPCRTLVPGDLTHDLRLA
jgi:uncharacterized protein (DUF2126 family)